MKQFFFSSFHNPCSLECPRLRCQICDYHHTYCLKSSIVVEFDDLLLTGRKKLIEN